MPTENFKSREAYRRWNAYRHIHGIPAPRLQRVCIAGKCHKVKHGRLSDRKLGRGGRRTGKRYRERSGRKRE